MGDREELRGILDRQTVLNAVSCALTVLAFCLFVFAEKILAHVLESVLQVWNRGVRFPDDPDLLGAVH